MHQMGMMGKNLQRGMMCFGFGMIVVSSFFQNFVLTLLSHA